LGLQGSTALLMVVAAVGLVPLALAVRLKPDSDPVMVRLKADSTPDRGRNHVGDRRSPASIRPDSGVESAFRRTIAVAAVIAIASLAAWLMLPRDYITTRALPKPEPGERFIDQSEGVIEIVTVQQTALGRK